jgi:flavin-dependent dehydrogenase
MKIAIIGAGPAGANCAYWASKEGHEVVLYEKNTDFALKPCGEGVFKEAFEYVPIKPEESKWSLSYIHRAEVYYKNKLLLETDTSPFDGYIINKRAFLRELVEYAIDEGARFQKGSYFVEKDDFDLIIDAGGYVSTFARRKGIVYNNYKLAPAIRGYGKSSKIREDTLYFEVYNFGYSWIFPYGKGYCNFGIGGHTNNKSLMLNNLYSFLKLFDVEIVSKIEGAAFPSNGPLEKLTLGKIRVAGDTAGMVMPISGEGIRFALYAGKICYKENYEELFKQKYGKKLENGKKILDFWLSLNEEELKILIKEMDPLKLIMAFLEGEKPSVIEGFKFLKKPNVILKALQKVYI